MLDAEIANLLELLLRVDLANGVVCTLLVRVKAKNAVTGGTHEVYSGPAFWSWE
jgi:hypothetical protein